MTTEGDGDQKGSIDQSDADSSSVDALLAELLDPGKREQPEGDEPLTGNESAVDSILSSPDESPGVEDHAEGEDDTIVIADDVVGSEDPTAVFPVADTPPAADSPGPSVPRIDVPVPVTPEPVTPESEVAADQLDSGDTSGPEGPAIDASSGGFPVGSALKLGVLLVLGLYLLLVGAWAVDLARHQGEVMRGVDFAGTPLDGLTRAEVDEVFDLQRQELAATPIDVVIGETTVTTDPVTLGMSFDRDAIFDEAMDVGRTGFFPIRPVTWLTSLFGRQEIEPRYAIDADTTTEAADTVIAGLLEQPEEPEIVLDGNEQLVVEPGSSGITLSTRELVGRLPSTIEAGTPYRLELQAIVAEPKIDQQALEVVATEINTLTADPIRVQVLDDIARVEPSMLKGWAVVDTEGEPSWSFDPTRVLSDLRPLFPTLGSEDQQARFTVVDGEPVIVPASETVVCCDEESVGRLRPGLAAPIPVDDGDDDEEPSDDEEGEPARTLVLEPTIVGFDEGVAELESLGIVEEVSTFTTNHACCENRVRNIQRFADLMQGVIIRPGESFSLNDHVGRRTIEKGFVADGAINLGVLEPQVGGGISQYATTFFNASFFAGLEFLEYQSHSLYISRYPRGREATISWRRPDLEVRNNTPYGILVWNEYTSTSITVTFYSTKHLEVEALPLRRSSERQCRVDITPRLITYPDGTQTEDTVFAVYRPGEGLDCAGNSTRPELEEPAAPAPEPEPEPQPEPEPEPEPEPDDGGGGGGNGGGNGNGGDGQADDG